MENETQKAAMQRGATKREKFFLTNYLTCLVKGLEGQYTTIDLRNESCVTGKIKEVDGYMNVEVEDAVFYDQRGFEHPFEMFFIRARLIRYVHIPKERKACQIIEEQLGKSRGQFREKKKYTLKISRAQKYNQEIMREIGSKSKT